ncbi:pyrroline-5-carboxylate reductase [Holotrichia oblita]|nr:pyrroline-5-carboxylate reductase [Holotrichia oblita]
MFSNQQIGFMGGGAMAQALIGGMLKADLVKPDKISVCDISEKTLDYLANTFKVTVCLSDTDDCRKMVEKSDFLFLAVKPNVIYKVLDNIVPFIKPSTAVVSVAAGITTVSLEEKLPSTPVVRAMPNTPAFVGAGMTALVKGKYADEKILSIVSEIFSAVGQVISVEENAMDAVTALSGSGPAYTFLLIDALADAGVKEGLSWQNSLLLAAQTLLGAAKMVIQTGEHPAKLKNMVTSPGGTTIAGLQALEKRAVRAAIMEAVEAAANRSREMADGDDALASRLLDLAEGALKSRKYKVSEFLDPHGFNIAETVAAHYPGISLLSSGGYEGAERLKAAFIEKNFLEMVSDEAIDYSLNAISLTWDWRYYNLSHRDVLGALMGQGIKREVIGDIIMQKDACQIVLDSKITGYIQSNFTQIAQASVTIETIDLKDIEPKEEKIKDIKATVASLRLDSVAAAGFGMSRSRMAEEIAAAKLKVNWQETTNASHSVKLGDVISMRGRGRVEVCEIPGKTKKGRFSIALRRFL